jgi:hypothetical protein
MIKSFHRGSWVGYVVVAVLATVIAGGGMAFAASSTAKTIKACASKKTGALRLASTCKKTEKKVTWSVTGPEGAKGARGVPGGTGVRGVTGPRGAKGARGVPSGTGPSDAYEATDPGVHTITTLSYETLTVTVPAGSYDISATGDELNFDGSHPGGMQVILYHGTEVVGNYLNDVWVTAPADGGGSIGAGAASATVHGSLTTATPTTISVEFSAYSSTNEVVRDPTLSVIKVGTIHTAA